ncbi:radical SAM protein [Streptomyces sp. CG1]|uniref:radical SAM protein n=1 Tax=Streptomyces sp. CG1 TaxID=1287523 RepID=UPI0034E22904
MAGHSGLDMIRLNLAVARSCFVRCRGCYNHFSGERQLVTVESIRTFLEYCQRHTDVSGVTLCGGDPLSRPDIVTLVSEIAALGIPVKLDTVGSSFLGSRELRFFGAGQVEWTDPALLVPQLNWIGIPLDGWSEESVAYFREGRPHLFAETLEVLRVLSQFETPIGVNTVVHRRNVDGLKKIEAALGSFKVSEWQLFEYRPSGPLSFRNRDQFMLEPGHFKEIDAAFSGPRDSGTSPELVTAKGAREILPSRLVVDSNGLAWSHLEWVEPPSLEPGPRRSVAGNIQNPEDHANILAAALACLDGRVQSEGKVATTGWMSDT